MKRSAARSPQPADLSAWWRHGHKLWEISLATPQVIAHRSARMATAGTQPPERDRREFMRMGQEKVEAFGESWLAMGLRFWQAQQAAWWSSVQDGWKLWATPWAALHNRPSTLSMPSMQAWQRHAANTLSSMIDGGMAPVHRRVTANAKRLARVKLSPSKRK